MKKLKKLTNHYPIFLLGSFGQNNIGDELILLSFLKFCKENKLTPIVSSRNPEQTKTNFNVESIHTSPKREIVKKIKTLITSKAYIFAGGTILIEHPITISGIRKYFRKPLYYVLSLVILGKILNKKVILSHIGISPLESNISKFLAKRIIVFSDLITVRDKQSFVIAKKLYPSDKVILVADSVFSLIDFNSINKLPNNKNNLAIIPNYYSFPSIDEERDKTVNRFVLFIRNVLKKKEFNKIILFPFRSNFGEKHDLWVSREIYKRLKDKRVKIVQVEITNKLVIDVIKIFKNISILITQRQHGMLLAYFLGIPLIGVNLDPKITAFIKENFNTRNILSLGKLNVNNFDNLLKQPISVDMSKRKIIKKKSEYGFYKLKETLFS